MTNRVSNSTTEELWGDENGWLLHISTVLAADFVEGLRYFSQ